MMPTAATLVFGAWVAVNVANITQPVPEFQHTGIPGAVQSSEWLRQKPSDQGCPIYDGGAVIGFSLGCRQSSDFSNPATLIK